MVNQTQLEELSSYLDEIDKLFDSIEGIDNNSYSNPSASPSPSPTKCFIQGGFYAKGKLNPGEVAVDLINTIGNQTANVIDTAGRAVSTVVNPRGQECNPRGQCQPPSQGVVYPPGGGQQYPPGHQSGQSVQPPSEQWHYVPGGQEPSLYSDPSGGYGGYAEANASARGGEANARANASSNLSRPPPRTKSGIQRCQAPSSTKSYLEGGLDFSARIAPIEAAVDVINAAGNQTANVIDKAGMAAGYVVSPVAENVRNVAVNLVNPRGPEIYQYQPPPQVVVYPPGGGQQYPPSNQSDQSVQPPSGQWVYVPAGQKPPHNAYSNLSGPPPRTKSGVQRCQAPSSTKSYLEGGLDFRARVSPSEAAVDLINAAGNQTANIIEHAGRAAGHVVSPVADNVGNVAVNLVNPRGQGIYQYQPPSQVVVNPPGSGQQYPPSNQSDQSVQLPPGKWVYVPAGQKPPPNSYSNLSRSPPSTRSGLQRHQAPSPTKCFIQGGFNLKGKLNPGEVAVDLINTIGNQTANVIGTAGRAVSTVVNPRGQECNPRGQCQQPSQGVVYPPVGEQQYPPGGGQQYPPGGGQQYPPGGGQQYPPGHQSGQSVQPPSEQWHYVPGGQEPSLYSDPSGGYGGYAEANASARGGEANASSNLSRPPPRTKSGLQRCQAPSSTKSYLEGGLDFRARVSPSEAAVDLINAAGNQTANLIEHAGRAAGHVVSPVADNVGNVAVNLVNPRGQGIYQYQPPSQVVVNPPGSGQQYPPSNQSDQSVQLPPGKWVYVPAGQKPPPNSYSNLSRPPPSTRSGLQRHQAPSPTKCFIQGGFYAKGKLNPGEVAVDLINTIGNQTANVIDTAGRAVSTVVNSRGQECNSRGQCQLPSQGVVYPPGGGQQYPPGQQSDQSVQPPGKWVYVPDVQKPPPPTRNSPTWVSDPTRVDSHPNMRKSYKDICKTLEDMDRLVDNILVKLE